MVICGIVAGFSGAALTAACWPDLEPVVVDAGMVGVLVLAVGRGKVGDGEVSEPRLLAATLSSDFFTSALLVFERLEIVGVLFDRGVVAGRTGAIAEDAAGCAPPRTLED